MPHGDAQLSRAQQRLAAEHLPLVTKVARRIFLRLPGQCTLDELESAGALGLVEAARRFQRARKIPFGAFARHRIRGAILDYLRGLDPLVRSQRERLHGEPFFDLQFDALEECQRDRVSVRTAQTTTCAAAYERARVQAAVDALPDRFRRIIVRRYYEDGTLRSLEEEFGVRNSRVSALHTQAIAMLREMLTGGPTSGAVN